MARGTSRIRSWKTPAAGSRNVLARRGGALALLGLVAFLGLVGSAEPSALRTGTTLSEVTLRVAAMPNGAVTLDPAGKDAFGNELDRCTHDESGGECRVVYSVGATPLTVTLTAEPGSIGEPASAQEFYGWSTPECGTAPTCAVTLTDSAEPPQIWALFTKAQLSVLVVGDGTVTSDARQIDCDPTRTDSPSTCSEALPAGTPVTLTTTPKNPGEAVTWVFGCDPGDDPNASTCVTRPENRYVGVRFGSAPGPAPPFDVDVSFRVTTVGAGTVTGGPITCPSSCAATVDFGARLKLTATPASQFDRWMGGPCGANPTCTLNAGPVTSLRAIFKPVASESPAAPPPSAPAPEPAPPPPAPPPPLPPPRAAQPVDTAQSPAATDAAKLSARVLGTSSRRVGGRYRVFTRIDVSKHVNARFRVARGTRVLGQRLVPLGPGQATTWLALARSTRAGPCWLLIRLRDADGHVVTIRRRMTIGG